MRGKHCSTAAGKVGGGSGSEREVGKRRVRQKRENNKLKVRQADLSCD